MVEYHNTPCARGLHTKAPRPLHSQGHTLVVGCADCEPLIRDLLHPGTIDEFAEADRANVERAKAVALDNLQRARAARRDVQPLPAGSLFDQVARDTRDLF